MKTKLSMLMLSLAGAGCATVEPPKDLVTARQMYEQEANGKTGRVNPAALYEAKKAIDIANDEFNRDPESVETRDFSYIALRKTQLASTKADIDLAVQRKAQAEKNRYTAATSNLKQTREELAAARERNRATGEQLSRTAEELERERQAAAGAAAELERERVARADAERRLQETANELSRLSDVKRDERGLVLTLSGSVLFASGKDALLPGAKSKLDEVAAALVKSKSKGFVIEGHTDSQGSDSTNMDLSKRRAEAVRNYLVERGVPAEEVRAIGKGEGTPVAENGTAEGRANNRRVEIVVLKADSAKSLSSYDREE